MLWNAVSTLVESSADVSINDKLFCSAKARASSVGTARRCLRSDLLPTNMITMLASAWSRSSRSLQKIKLKKLKPDQKIHLKYSKCPKTWCLKTRLVQKQDFLESCFRTFKTSLDHFWVQIFLMYSSKMSTNQIVRPFFRHLLWSLLNFLMNGYWNLFFNLT